MKKTLSKWLYEMKRKAHGTQKPRHADGAVEVSSTAQRGDSLVQPFTQRFLKRAANPLLILLKYPLMAFLRALAKPASVGGAGAALRRPPLCYIYRQGESMLCRAIFRTSSSPRSCNPARLGEERISGLAHVLLMFSIFCLTFSHATASETAMTAEEEIAAIIRAEVMAMPEWKDADIRVEIKGGIKSNEISAPGDSFRLAPKGLTAGRRNVIAPIDVIRDGKAVRSLSVPAVVHISSTALTASRKIASGEMVSENDICEGKFETTDIRVALIRDPKDIEGKIARRSFAAGELLPLDAFIEAPLVRRGDLVNVRLERDGITLTSTARASENGRFGDVIQVKSVDFSSIIKARVTGQSQVSVQ